jgi:hypothetical protein
VNDSQDLHTRAGARQAAYDAYVEASKHAHRVLAAALRAADRDLSEALHAIEEPGRQLPPHIEKIIAEGRAAGISYSMHRNFDGRRHVSAIHLDQPERPDPLADAITAKVTEDIDMPVIIDGQWFAIHRLSGPVPLV